MEGEKLVYTVAETAEILGIGRGLAYEATRRGEIPSIRIGHRILVPRKALEDLINRGGLQSLRQLNHA